MDVKSARLKNIILSRFPSVKAFARETGIPYTTLATALKNGIGGMAADKVLVICGALQIDFRTLEPLTPDSAGLTLQERELLQAFRSMDGKSQEQVLQVLKNAAGQKYI